MKAGPGKGKSPGLVDEDPDDLEAFIARVKDSAVTIDEDRLASDNTKSELLQVRESIEQKRVWKGRVQINVNWCRTPGELCEAARARRLDMYWVVTLMRKMKHCIWVLGALPMVVVLHPDESKSKVSFSMDDLDAGKYTCFVLGGNHSLQARTRLAAQYQGVTAYQWMEATVLAGLTQEEMRVVATYHNNIAEARKNFSFIDRVRYMRHEVLERRRLKLPTLVDWKLEVYVRLGLMVQ